MPFLMQISILLTAKTNVRSGPLLLSVALVPMPGTVRQAELVAVPSLPGSARSKVPNDWRKGHRYCRDEMTMTEVWNVNDWKWDLNYWMLDLDYWMWDLNHWM